MDPQQIMTRLKALAASLSPGQIASLLAAFVVVVGILVGGAYWANTPAMALLVSDMEPDAASSMVSRLKTLKVQYVLDQGGRAIRVPADRVDELRLELASQGLPESGRIGFEIFDRTNFGATEFLEKVNFRRALEGEIARTIGTIAEVASARVHISMGKQELFGESEPAKAAVFVKLRGSRDLSSAAVNGISNLVAGSVDGLRADNVTIIDSYGRPLARPAADEHVPGGAAQLERQQRLEHEMGARVVALLEPVIGPDRVRVNVALKLNPATVEQTEETYDPTPIVRSKQVSSDTTSSSLPGGGLAGVRGNQPPPAPDQKTAATKQLQASQTSAQTAPIQQAQAQFAAATASTSGASRSAETVNYEVNRKLVVTQRPPGEIARLSLAVIVDDEQVTKKGSGGAPVVTRKARSPEELQRLQGIVAAAVGLEPERGDQITVQNVSFEEPPPIDEPQTLTRFEQVTRYSPQIWEGARLLAVVILGALAMIFFVRPLMRRASGVGPGGQQAMALAGPGQPLRTVADLESEIEAQLDASAHQKVDARRLPVLARKVSSMSAKEPENVAKLLRSWINEGER